MIIWRGWGILAFLLPALGAGIMSFVADMVGAENILVFIGVGVALGGIGDYFLGNCFNHTNAAQKAATWRAARQEQLHHLVQAGQFQLAPGVAAPRNLEEAQAQATKLLEAEHAQVVKAYKNRHTLFFVPMQWVSFLFLAIGLFMVVSGLMQ